MAPHLAELSSPSHPEYPDRYASAALPSHRAGRVSRRVRAWPVTVREDACWAGAGSSGVARGARVYEKYMEGSSGGDGGCMGPAMPVVCLSTRVRGKIWLGGPRAVVPGTGESGAEVLLPAGLGSCTGLYVAVRGIGGEGADAHVHMADSVAGTNAEGVLRSVIGAVVQGTRRRANPFLRCGRGFSRAGSRKRCSSSRAFRLTTPRPAGARAGRSARPRCASPW